MLISENLTETYLLRNLKNGNGLSGSSEIWAVPGNSDRKLRALSVNLKSFFHNSLCKIYLKAIKIVNILQFLLYMLDRK